MDKASAKAAFDEIDITARNSNCSLDIPGSAFTAQPCVVKFGKLWKGRVQAQISYRSAGGVSYGLQVFDGYGFDNAWQAVDEWVKKKENRSLAP